MLKYKTHVGLFEMKQFLYKTCSFHVFRFFKKKEISSDTIPKSVFFSVKFDTLSKSFFWILAAGECLKIPTRSQKYTI